VPRERRRTGERQAAHGEHYTGRVRATQEETSKKAEKMRLPALDNLQWMSGVLSLLLLILRGTPMADWKELESQLAARLCMNHRPVAISFLDAPPAGVPKFSGSEPADCSLWRLAAAGRRTRYKFPKPS
jgi:hypothetical protein